MNTKYCSIVCLHYHDVDDFGETAAGSNPPKRSDLMKNLLDSIEKNTDYPAEVVFWDNGGKESDDSTFLLDKVRQGKINYYIRSKNNLHFAMAWNNAVKLATGDYICLMCNDIEVLPGWLSATIKILEDYPDRQWVATPFISYDKKKQTLEITKEGYRVNMRSGSNCMVFRRSDWEKLGEFPIHRVGGSLWYTKNFRAGWRFVAPPEDLAIDRGWRRGVNFSIPIKVTKKLLRGEEINFEEPIQ